MKSLWYFPSTSSRSWITAPTTANPSPFFIASSGEPYFLFQWTKWISASPDSPLIKCSAPCPISDPYRAKLVATLELRILPSEYETEATHIQKTNELQLELSQAWKWLGRSAHCRRFLKRFHFSIGDWEPLVSYPPSLSLKMEYFIIRKFIKEELKW